jgi:Tfp pilus assembly protein PilF
VSQLLDSLRRANRTAPGGARHFQPPGAGAAAVLATMEYGTRRQPSVSWRLGTAAVGVVMLGTCLYLFAWNASPAPRPIASAELPVTRPPAAIASPKPQIPAKPAAETTAPRRQPSDDFRRALNYQRAGEFDSAAALYRTLLARDELRAQVHNNLGLIEQQRGRIEEALRHFEQAVLSDPQYARAHNNLGVLLLRQHRIDEAAARFRAAAELDPRDPDAIVNVALAQKAAGRPEQAKESLLSALTLSPHSAPAHYNLAVLYDQSGERARALEHYRAFLDRRGDEYADRLAAVKIRMAAIDKDR